MATAPKAPVLGGDEGEGRGAGRLGVRRRGEAAPRPRDGSRGDERRPRGHTWRKEPRPRRRRPLEAVASEGNGTRTRRHHARAAVDGRRHGVPARHAQLRGEGEPQGAPGRAQGRSERPCGQRDDRAARRLRLRRTVDPQGGRAHRRVVGAADPRRRDRGRGGPREVVPEPRPGARHRSGRARGRLGRLGALAARDRGRPPARPRPRRAPRTEEAAE